MFNKSYIIVYETPTGIFFDAVFIENAIKQFTGYAKITSNSWIVVSNKKPLEITNQLIPLLPLGSRIFVSKITAPSAWNNVIANSEWLQSNL